MAWEISKDFTFSYGHRVHTRILGADQILVGSCECRHLHGHEGTVSVYMGADELDQTGQVTDIVNLRWFDKFLKDYIDHKFIIDENDPLYEFIIQEQDFVEIEVPGTDWVVGKIVDMSGYDPGDADYEYFESFFIVNFIPTAEMLAEWAWRVTQCRLIDYDVSVFKTTWRETSKHEATYVHVHQAPEPEPPTAEEIAATESMLEKRRNIWTPPTGGFDLYREHKNNGKKE